MQRGSRVATIATAVLVLAGCGDSADRQLPCIGTIDFVGAQTKAASLGANLTQVCSTRAPWQCDVFGKGVDQTKSALARANVAVLAGKIEECLVAKRFTKVRPEPGMFFFDAPAGETKFRTCGLDLRHKGGGDVGFRFVCA